jgi:LemA protein
MSIERRYSIMRNKGSAGSLIAVFFIGLLAIALFLGIGLFGWYKSGYNKAVKLSAAADAAWANVESDLQRRFDLIPNLVETVKGYATHEQELFEHIADARTKYFSAGTTEGKVEAANQLQGFLSRLLVLQEQYPQLKANENFRDLTVALEGTENRISVARTRYNDAVRALNEYTKSFFGSFFAKRAGVQPREYFQATDQAKTEVPKVDFSQPASSPPPPGSPNAP